MRLVVRSSGEVIDVRDEEILVGASPRCAVKIAGAASEHARLVDDVLEAFAECVLGGVPLLPGQRRVVVPGASLVVGGAIVDVEDSPPPSSLPTREIVLRAAAVMTVTPCVVVAQPAGAPPPRRAVERALLPLTEDGHRYVVGRSSAAALVLADAFVSREHLEIVREGDSIFVRDLGATRGTFLGGARLAPGRKALWSPAQMLQIGGTILALSVPPPREAVLPSFHRETRTEPLARHRGELACAPSPAAATTAPVAPVAARATWAGVEPAPTFASASRGLWARTPAERAQLVLLAIAVAFALVTLALLLLLPKP